MNLESALSIAAFSLPLVAAIGLVLYVSVKYGCIRSREYIPLV
jgi:hypothetical protein